MIDAELKVLSRALRDIKALDAQRTPGKWYRSHEALWETAKGNMVGLFAGKGTDPTKTAADARFVMALVNHWPTIEKALEAVLNNEA